MNLPFGLPIIKETHKKKDDNVIYERKLEEYRNALENYKRCIIEYTGRLDHYDERYLNNQLSIVQIALDITYLKEQEEKTIELLEDIKSEVLSTTQTNLENLTTAVLDSNYKLEGLDKNVVNRISQLLFELQRQTLEQNKNNQMEITADFEQLNCKVRKNHSLLIWLFLFNILGIGGLVFIALYLMEFIWI